MMSNIVFYCPKCGQKIKAPDIMGGEVGDCPKCQMPIIIPHAESAPRTVTTPSGKFALPSPKPTPIAHITQIGNKPDLRKSVPAYPVREAERIEQKSNKLPKDSGLEIVLKRPEYPKTPPVFPEPPTNSPIRIGQAEPVPKTAPATSSWPQADKSFPTPKRAVAKSVPPPTVTPAEKMRLAPSKPTQAPVTAQRTVPPSAPNSSESLPDVSGLKDDSDSLSSDGKQNGGNILDSLAWIPALLSLLPGLGQACNLQAKKATVFAALFILVAGWSVFKPEQGLAFLLLTIFISMGDAYGGGLGVGFLKGIGRGAQLAIRAFFALIGLLLWVFMTVLLCDTLAAGFNAGHSILTAMEWTGSDNATRTLSIRVALSLVFSAGLLLVSLHGFGRKLLWARNRSAHFLFALRIALAALALTGLLAVAISWSEGTRAPEILADIFASPPLAVQRMLRFPQPISVLADNADPAMAPGILDSAITWMRAFGHSTAASFGRYAVAYRFALLIGLTGVLSFLLCSMIRFARALSECGEWRNIRTCRRHTGQESDD